MADATDDQLNRVRDAMRLLSSEATGNPVADIALGDIADAIDEANDGCCGCSWPGSITDILRGDD